MISKTVTFTNYNDEKQTERVWFHIKKHELIENQDLGSKFEHLALTLQGDGSKRELSREDVMEILELVKRVIRISYGVRSEDGLKHRKSQEIWDDFADSAQYDAILFSLFEDPEEGMKFLAGCMPADLLEEAKAEIARREAEKGPRQPQDRQPKLMASPSPDDVKVEPGIDVDDTFKDEDDEETPEQKRARLQAEIDALG